MYPKCITQDMVPEHAFFGKDALLQALNEGLVFDNLKIVEKASDMLAAYRRRIRMFKRRPGPRRKILDRLEYMEARLPGLGDAPIGHYEPQDTSHLGYYGYLVFMNLDTGVILQCAQYLWPGRNAPQSIQDEYWGKDEPYPESVTLEMVPHHAFSGKEDLLRMLHAGVVFDHLGCLSLSSDMLAEYRRQISIVKQTQPVPVRTLEHMEYMEACLSGLPDVPIGVYQPRDKSLTGYFSHSVFVNLRNYEVLQCVPHLRPGMNAPQTIQDEYACQDVHVRSYNNTEPKT